jgi:hypothetical protein
MGILAMIFLAMSQIMGAVKKAIFNRTISVRQFIFLIIFGILSLFILLFASFNYDKFISLFEGLPFLSRYWHSATIRIDDFFYTWKIFINSPYVGYSLGGVAPAIAQLKGHIHITQEIVKNTEGMCIFLEVLAASGIIGFAFFLLFLIKLLRSSSYLKKLFGSQLNTIGLQFLSTHYFLVLALIFQLLLLCLNQNILRNYLWTHIAIVNVSFFVLRDGMRASLFKNDQ